MDIITQKQKNDNITTNEGKEIWNTSIKRYPELGIVEVYRLKNGFRVKGNYGGIRGTQKDEKKKQENQKKADIRAKTKIRELILRNNLKYHWTFHYGEIVEDREKATNDFMNFIKRLNYHIRKKENIKTVSIGPTMPYVAVMEIQPGRKEKYGDEVIHFHLATDRFLPFWEVHEIWGHGGAWVTPYSGDVVKVATYLTKYITKIGQEGQVRQEEQKRYLRSRGLKEPIREQTVTSESEFQDMVSKANAHCEYEDKEEQVFAEWIQMMGYVKNDEREKRHETNKRKKILGRDNK